MLRSEGGVPKLNMMRNDNLVSGFWIRKIQLREHRLFSGNIFRGGLRWTPASGISM
jgi:hypothetical protein